VTWQEHREAQLQKAIKHWLVIISTWSDTVEFVQCISGCDSVNSQLIMLGDVSGQSTRDSVEEGKQHEDSL